MKKWGLFTAVMIVFLVIAAGCQSKTDAAFENINTEEAKELIDGEKVEVIDVRTEEEYKQGHIPGARLIPVDELASRLEELKTDRSYLIVCRSGNRSSQASQTLVDNGFSHIYNLATGMNDWTYDVEY